MLLSHLKPKGIIAPKCLKIQPSQKNQVFTKPMASTGELRQEPKHRQTSTNCDLAIIGGGIIGAAIARQLKLDLNDLDIRLLEKEGGLGKHQSSHNSGVMHCGIYYAPGSLKAQFCVPGTDLLQRYCDQKGLSYRKSGKLIVARDCGEAEVLGTLLERAQKNQVRGVELLDSPRAIQSKSQGCRGLKALWCPSTANVNFREVTQQFGRDFEGAGGKISLNTKIVSLKESCNADYPLQLSTEEGSRIQSKNAILCGGLQASQLTQWVEGDALKSSPQLISLKVDYQQVAAKYCNNLATNIYPVPDLEVPFLGPHFSPQQDGTILLGPWAVPALGIEGYCNDQINLPYISQVVSSGNFRNMVRRHFSKCLHQASKALCSDVQIKALQRLLPHFSYQFVEKGPTAVQCQLLSPDGSFVDDFVFRVFQGQGIGQRVINVQFAPSPAATSSMAIAAFIAEEFKDRLRQC